MDSLNRMKTSMILFLTNSLRVKGDEDPTYLRFYKHCIRNLANAAIEGCHILRGEYEILCDCRKMFEGDDEFEIFFRGMVNNYFTMTIPPDITYYIEVVKDNPEELKENECIIAQRCIEDFYMSSSLLCCQFICEDENDCKFYEFVADWYMKRNSLKYHLKISEEGGGGGRTIDKVIKHLKDKRICLCIVDADQKYPEMEINPKSKACVKIDDHQCGYRCIAINVHEIENILPLNYIDDLINTFPKYRWPMSQLQKKHFDYLSLSNEANNILPYFDYKNGIRKTPEYIRDTNYQKYAKLCWQYNPEISKGHTFEEFVDALPLKGIIYHKLSDSISADVLYYISELKKNGSLNEPALLPYQEVEWCRIGKELVNWGCARIPEGIS